MAMGGMTTRTKVMGDMMTAMCSKTTCGTTTATGGTTMQHNDGNRQHDDGA